LGINGVINDGLVDSGLVDCCDLVTDISGLVDDGGVGVVGNGSNLIVGSNLCGGSIPNSSSTDG